MKTLIALLLLALASQPAPAADNPVLQQVAELQARWAQIKYQRPEAEREAAFATLAADAAQQVNRHPDAPELLIWHGIILSTYAGEKGGLGALSLVKQARSNFEQAIELDPKALSGSAYTSLGALYYQVPGWPISFGSDRKARQYLEQALTLNPDGIDSNFFYGDFLANEREIEKARQVLQHALEAADRPDRPLADQGRREEIRQLLAKLKP